MADYIEREALLEQIDGIWDCADLVFEPNDHCCRADDCASCKWRETKNAIRKIAAYLPAANVRPVVRGKWKHSIQGIIPSGQCSNCGAWDKVTRFCPNCGAMMEES